MGEAKRRKLTGLDAIRHGAPRAWVHVEMTTHKRRAFDLFCVHSGDALRQTLPRQVFWETPEEVRQAMLDARVYVTSDEGVFDVRDEMSDEITEEGEQLDFRFPEETDCLWVEYQRRLEGAAVDYSYEWCLLKRCSFSYLGRPVSGYKVVLGLAISDDPRAIAGLRLCGLAFLETQDGFIATDSKLSFMTYDEELHSSMPEANEMLAEYGFQVRANIATILELAVEPTTIYEDRESAPLRTLHGSSGAQPVGGWRSIRLALGVDQVKVVVRRTRKQLREDRVKFRKALHSVKPHPRTYKRTGLTIMIPGHVRGDPRLKPKTKVARRAVLGMGDA